MEKIKIEDLELGKDYETMDTMKKKGGIKSAKGVYYRIDRLRERGAYTENLSDSNGNWYWLKKYADKIINIDFSEKEYDKEKPPLDSLKLGIDYETMETMQIKGNYKSEKGFFYRRTKLKMIGVIIIRHTDNRGNQYFLREDADQIINIDFSRFRKKDLKKPFKEPQEKGIYTPIPEGFILGTDYETMESIQEKSKYKTRKDFNLRVINLSVYSKIDLHTKYIDNYTRWWLPVDAEIIINYRKKRVNKI